MSPSAGLVAIVLGDADRSEAAATVARQLERLPMAVEVRRCPSTANDVADAVRTSGASYVLVVEQNEAIDASSIEKTLAALDDAPEAVLGTAGLLWRPPALGLDVATRDWRRDDARLHEGRRLARLLALRAVTFPTWNAVLLRAAALGSDLPRSESLELRASGGSRPGVASAATLRASLALELLVRGFASSLTHLGYWPRSRAALVEDVQAWAAAFPTAERLGLFEEPDDPGRAVANLLAEAERCQLERALLPSLAARSPRGPSPLPNRATAPEGAPKAPDSVAFLRSGATGRITAAVTGKVGPLRRFLIAAGDYLPNAAGPAALHLLCHRLNRLGYDATIAPVGISANIPALGLTNPDWLTPLAKVGDRFDRCVAIYPENVAGNPLNSPWVVRWLLHRPGYFNGSPTDAGPDDLVVAWDRAIAPEVPVFSLPLVDLATYHPKGAPGRGRLLWVGKGRVPASLDRTGMTEISRSWPRDHAALADLLRSAELLVSCDWLSSLTDESLMCGTPVAFAGIQHWAEGEPMDIATHLAPGVIPCPDGWPTADQLDLATKDCARFQMSYRRRAERLDEEIHGFVRMINAHFDRVARSLAATGS